MLPRSSGKRGTLFWVIYLSRIQEGNSMIVDKHLFQLSKIIFPLAPSETKG